MADTEKIIRKKYDVPIWHKSNLTIDEAVEYSGIGRERLRKLTSQEECPFVLHIGTVSYTHLTLPTIRLV